MPPCVNRSANNPFEIDTKIIPLEQLFLVLGDIKSYGKRPFISSGTLAPHPVISSGKQIKNTSFLMIDNEIKNAICMVDFICI
jgi:hypothetical protein